MTNMDTPQGPMESAADDQLVVGLADLRLVTQVLDGLQVRWGAVHEEPRLGLALLTDLRGLAGRARLVRLHHGTEMARLEAGSGRPFTDLDAVLFGLRGHFAETFGGWVPELAKNRDVGGVVSQPGGGAGKSMAIDPPIALDELPPSTAMASASDGSAARIGVLDTPLFPHPALAGAIEGGDVAFDPDANLAWQPWQGHATFVASLVLGRAPSATLVLRPVLTSQTGTGRVWDLATAMVDVGTGDGAVDIVNLSLGCRTADGRPPLVLTKAVQKLGPNVLVIAAAGNHRETEHAAAPIWPAALPGVVAVTVTAEPEVPGVSGSGFAANLPWITCTAAGVRVPGMFITGDVLIPSDVVDPSAATEPPPMPAPFTGAALWSGTSFAAATVSGAVAARMTGGLTARKALDALLADPAPDAVVRRFVYPATR